MVEKLNIEYKPPKYGLKIRLDHKYPVKSKQSIEPRASQAISLIPLSLRYMSYYINSKLHNRRPNMDFINTVTAQRIYGCPLGGIGGGTIGRGYRGEFCRFQLNPGFYEYLTVPGCQFIVNIRNEKNETIFQSVLSTYEKPKNAPSSWEWNLNGADCDYTGLYPRAWTEYDLSKYGVKLTCRQISPIIAHNYKDSSLPCAVFVWTVRNLCKEARSVSVTFTWSEIACYKNKQSNKVEVERYSDEYTSGVSLEQQVAGSPCTFTIAKLKQADESINSDFCFFRAEGDGSTLWSCLKTHGKLLAEARTEGEKGNKMQNCRNNAMGLSSMLVVDAGAVAETEFCLAWDMPTIKFRKRGRIFKRFYTKFFGCEGIAGGSIATYALLNYQRWEKEISNWQEPILSDSKIPDWLKGALMNQLYYIADGGTVWFHVPDEYPVQDPRYQYGLFGYLEGHEYRMYNTYDVHFYASFALAQLWPNLQVSLQYTYKDTIPQEINTRRTALYDGKSTKRKVPDSVPHDIGEPNEEPFTLINAYNVHDVSEWRDLNNAFILQVFRDYTILKNDPVGVLHSDKYQSLEYIDDISDSEDDLYYRSTNQDFVYMNNQINKTKVPHSTRLRKESHSETITPHHVNGNGWIKEPKPGGSTEETSLGNDNILSFLYRSMSVRDSHGRQSVTYSREDSGINSNSEKWDAVQYIRDMYPVCVKLVERMISWDKDGDGLIENTGSPDQTFDTWVMTGPSAYCAGMWLTALHLMKVMANILGRNEDEIKYKNMLEKGRMTFEKLMWNDTHYLFDTLPSNRNIVMAGQLTGHWYMRACGFQYEVFPREHVRTAIKTIYDNNVMQFCNGKMGAVNGYIPKDGRKKGHVAISATQSEEMWTGVTYGVAALMIHEGLYNEAFALAGNMYNTLSYEMGMSFEVPEALVQNGSHRAIGYMRPLSIWAMYHALNMQRLFIGQPNKEFTAL